MKRSKFYAKILAVAICTMALSGCGSGKQDTPASTPAVSTAITQETSASATPETTQTAAPSSTQAPAEELKWDTDTLKNDSGKTLIRCIGDQRNGDRHVSFGIVSSKGTTILTDPIYSLKDKVYIKADVITVTHTHSDHFNWMLLNKVKDYAKISSYSPESFTVNDVNVIGAAASHTSDPINESRPSNTIYVYELDGLRIAHMGDMGQDELTPEQLKKLGQLDIIFTIITNAPSYGSATEKNIKIIQQLKPKIVIPTHYADDVLSETIKALGVKEVERAPELAVSKDDLKDASMRFIIVE
ncbi:MAG TPA: MBL fold metallo-hydrolase [Clostridia bacterium]|nr:MBL fold metallo-hydrolase [Clostridia bacterium]